MATFAVILGEDVKKEGLHVVVESLVVQEQLGQQTQVLTVDCAHVPINLGWNQSKTHQHLPACVQSYTFKLLLESCAEQFGMISVVSPESRAGSQKKSRAEPGGSAEIRTADTCSCATPPTMDLKCMR